MAQRTFATFAAGGDVAAGCAIHPSQMGAIEAERQAMWQKEYHLQQALREVDVFTRRAQRADGERKTCSEATRSLKGSIRIMGRVRPPLPDEVGEAGCLRVRNRNQLEVLIQTRALLTDQPSSTRTRRCSTGCIGLRDSGTSIEPDAQFDASRATLEPRTYLFDDLFDADASDDEVFSSVGEELTAASEGEAVCILAYGATGSGKTHTVMNLAERAAQELERQASALAQGGLDLEIKVQLVEIYNQQFRDLLAVDTSKQTEPPQLKLSVSNSSTTILGAVSRTICHRTGGGIAASLEEALRYGQAQRATSATAVHGRSSRSHLVMTLFLTTRDMATGSLLRSGKLSLVDLAGSERLKRSEAVGERLKEAQHINRSLSALADVISAKERRVGHVPYRNSKLTHLLQDALGGQQQCRTVVVVALTPTWSSLNDTLHSLQFSSRLSALSLPTVVSRRSLRGVGSEHASVVRSAAASRCAVVDHEREYLKQEASKWRKEIEQAHELLAGYRRAIEIKDKQLEDAERRNAELRASAQRFEQHREQIYQGFLALNKRLEEVEASTAAAAAPQLVDGNVAASTGGPLSGGQLSGNAALKLGAEEEGALCVCPASILASSPNWSAPSGSQVAMIRDSSSLLPATMRHVNSIRPPDSEGPGLGWCPDFSQGSPGVARALADRDGVEDPAAPIPLSYDLSPHDASEGNLQLPSASLMSGTHMPLLENPRSSVEESSDISVPVFALSPRAENPLMAKHGLRDTSGASAAIENATTELVRAGVSALGDHMARGALVYQPHSGSVSARDPRSSDERHHTLIARMWSGSANSHRRGNTPRRGIQRDYVVERISDLQAQRLAAASHSADPCSLSPLGGPKLLLCPQAKPLSLEPVLCRSTDVPSLESGVHRKVARQANSREDDEYERTSDDDACDRSSISTSSDENAIRDRLRQALHSQSTGSRELCPSWMQALAPAPSLSPTQLDHGNPVPCRSLSLGREPVCGSHECPSSLGRGREGQGAFLMRAPERTSSRAATIASRSPMRTGKIGRAPLIARSPPTAPSATTRRGTGRSATSSSPVRQFVISQPQQGRLSNHQQLVRGGCATTRAASGPGRDAAGNIRPQILNALSPASRRSPLAPARQFAPVLSRRALDAAAVADQMHAPPCR